MTTLFPPTAAASHASLTGLRRATHTLAFALGVALVGAPIASQAQVAGAPGSAQAPHVDTSANGTPVINIVAPTQGGVSHNQYEHFNVDPKGVVLNNSGSVSQSQLAGYIVGNTNLAPGQAARVIVNEVTSANPSNLRGFTEVAGNRAEVVIANPQRHHLRRLRFHQHHARHAGDRYAHVRRRRQPRGLPGHARHARDQRRGASTVPASTVSTSSPAPWSPTRRSGPTSST